MTWTRLSDDFGDGPIHGELPITTMYAHVLGLVWCNRHTTDGRIPATQIRRILHQYDDPHTPVKELVDAGLWAHDEQADTYQLDWSDQEPSDRVNRRKQFNIARQRKFRDRTERHSQGDHSMCEAKHCRAAKAAIVDENQPVTADLDLSLPDATATHPFERSPDGVSCLTCGLPEQNRAHRQPVT